MLWYSGEKWVRRLCDLHDPAALDELRRLAPEVSEIGDRLGGTLATRFILQHVDQFHGSTVDAFRHWLRTFSPAEVSGWLIGRIKAGDAAALDYWLTKNRPQLEEWTEARLAVPSGRGADASDVIQNATFYVATHITHFRGHSEGELLAWLHNTLRCRAIDLSRKPRLDVLAPPSATDLSSSSTNPWGFIAANDSTPSQSAVRREEEEHVHALRGKQEEQIHDARGCLSEQELQVFKQREVCGRLLKTIALDLGLTAVETARLFYQARSRLQGKLPRMDGDDAPAARLRQLLGALPERQRQAIELKHVEGYSLKEISEVMDCTATAVGSEIYRGMRTLYQIRSTAGQESG